MRRFLKTKLAKVLMMVLIGVLLAGGVAYAATVIWSGTASVTIEEVVPTNGNGGVPDPEPPPPLTVSEPSVTKGAIEGGVWTVTILQGETETISMDVNNPRDTEAWVQLLVNGELGSTAVIPGVVVSPVIGHGFVNSLTPHSSLIMEFKISVAETVTGAVPDIALSIIEKPE